ncbi:hypothetical protein GGI07_005589 [Coemansia sp. Benny D115]|nr:hypothetical protein GGI07_005589 [Coemansia sp. Benny D115]
MLSYRDMARDLTGKVNAALEKRKELLESYQDIKRQLRLAQAENEHFLDMIYEAYPEVGDDLSTTDSDSDASSVSSSMTREPPHSAGSSEPRLTKRRRRQGKRDNRLAPKAVEPVRVDARGHVVLPLVVGRGSDEVRVLSLGKVVSEPDSYHTSRYIWPVGFRSTRMYPSMRKGSEGKSLYTSEILAGEDMPVFRVTAADMPDMVFEASSSSGVWKLVLDELTRKGVGVKTHASGPHMFGLSHLAVTKAVQELDGADKCRKYVMQKWLDPEPTGDAEEDDDANADGGDMAAE